jgi:phytoene dehydrogenase-like protein
MSYDVVIVGAGTAGLVSGCILADSGKRVLILEKHPYLGGRAMEHRYRGHQIGLSSHLVEDPGDSLTRACELVGVELTHSQRSDSMPFWDGDRWIPIQDRYSGEAKQGLKRCIEAVKELSFDDIDNLDHLSLREWMSRYTSDVGVYEVWEAISVLEQITLEPWEHSASENLFIRKLHYERKRTAGYSFWPMGGWESLWRRMAAAIEARGGEVRTRAKVDEVTIRDGAVQGVRLGQEEIEAAEVIVNAPVWNLNALFADDALPWDFRHRVKTLAANQNRACWFGYWIAAEEPVIASSTLEMASFFTTPRAGLPGYTLCFTGYDPSVSPAGEYLTCVGAAFDATKHYGDRAYYDRKFAELWEDIEEMMPAARGALWKKPHLVNTYGVICKPGQVGAARPDTLVRGVEGLYLTGDTTRARGIGIDKAARSGITTAEAVLGRRHEFFADTIRY